MPPSEPIAFPLQPTRPGITREIATRFPLTQTKALHIIIQDAAGTNLLLLPSSLRSA